MADPNTDPRTSQDGGRQGDASRQGGASQPGHLSPQIDETDPTAETRGGQIAQDREQSSGQGGGQT